jgi:hypothetical protein
MRFSRRAPQLRWPIAAGILFTLSACAGPDRSVAPFTGGPAFDVAGTVRLSGHVLGPHGTNICDPFPTGTMQVVQALDPGIHRVSIVADTLVCPDNSYTLDLAPGSYYRRVILQGASFLGTLPRITVDTKPVRLSGRPLTSDVRVEEGTEVRGGAYLDGAPFAGQTLDIQYAPPLLGTAALTNQAGADGIWAEIFGRIPPRLERGATYEVTCPEAFGAIVTRGPVVETMHIASPAVHLDCQLRTPSPATRFTHHSGQVVATAMPGDVGGISYDLSARYGFGWGVQYPIAAGEAPQVSTYTGTGLVASQLYRGGLIVAVTPDRLFTGFDTRGYTAEICPDRNVQCRGLGLDGRGRIGEMAGGGRVIAWEYSDAFTGSGLGLAVRQRSFDAPDGRDYVVFQFRFRNLRHATTTLYAGLWLDWDADHTATDDVGFTDFNGHLMYVTSAGGGAYFGSVTANDAAVAGNVVYDNGYPLAPDSMYAWVVGGHRFGSTWPSDKRTVHTVGPITLGRAATGDVWIAVVAGGDLQHLMDNAAAAQNAIAQLQATPDLDE